MLRKRLLPATLATLVIAASAAAATPARDAFKGTITSAGGAYKEDHGKVSIAIRAPAPGPTVRHATFRLSGTRCRGVAHCIRLTGRFRGTIEVIGPYNPDVGKHFTIAGSGTVEPLGHVQVTGTAVGTGFIMQGRESMQLTVTAARGSVTIGAQSRLVRGFTSP